MREVEVSAEVGAAWWARWGHPDAAALVPMPEPVRRGRWLALADEMGPAVVILLHRDAPMPDALAGHVAVRPDRRRSLPGWWGDWARAVSCATARALGLSRVVWDLPSERKARAALRAFRVGEVSGTELIVGAGHG